MIYDNIFESKLGAQIYETAERTILDFSMHDALQGGVLVGFSGGADSVLLLLLLNKFRKLHGNFNILAFHVNHLIRGDEAERDEIFAREFAESIGVSFAYERIDVPKLSSTLKIGLEEAARDARYSAFDRILQGRNDICAIATAHNATDNLETVLMNMMRGAGSRGVSGIRPVRGSILRPLIRIPKKDITDLLTESGVPFVVDSTNLSLDYRRNYIRNEIIPRFSKIISSPESAATRLSENLRCDDDFIESVKDGFLESNLKDGKVSRAKLSSLHKAVFARVIHAMVSKETDKSCERIHVESIYSHINDPEYAISLPGEVSFVISGDECFVTKEGNETADLPQTPLTFGVNELVGFDGVILISEEPFDVSFTNVYKISIQTTLSFDIISGGLYARSRADGDAYRCGGITRKLKKVFNDKSVPPVFRSNIPVICDREGILWVPGLPVRDGAKGADKICHIALAHRLNKSNNDPKRLLYKVTDWQHVVKSAQK